MFVQNIMNTLTAIMLLIGVTGMFVMCIKGIFSDWNSKDKKRDRDIDDEIDSIFDNKIEPLYSNGQLSNLGTIIALKSIKYELSHLLSSTEKDAIDKGIENTVAMEKINIFLESNFDDNEKN